MENFDDLAEKAAHILETVENYQWEIGKIANQVVEKSGFRALEDFSNQVERICGVRRAPASLRMYAHVWKISSKLNLPKDILFSTCQAIVFSDHPEKYAKMAQEGASRIDIKKAINKDKYAQED